jgi:hypothetical protein
VRGEQKKSRPGREVKNSCDKWPSRPGFFRSGRGLDLDGLGFVDGLLEILDGPAHVGPDLGQVPGTENKHRDDQDDEQFLNADTEHERLLEFGWSSYIRLGPDRSMRGLGLPGESLICLESLPAKI